MKKILGFIIINFFVFLPYLQAQNFEIKGNVKDAISGESLIGASVIIGEGKGSIADIDGNYSIKAEEGEYTVAVSYIGYFPQEVKTKIRGKSVILNFSLELKTLSTVEIVADVARTRETPIAFSNINAAQINEELSARDLPMILNYTPGVYATESGGGSGDSRITIRGFDQRNIGVLVDGIPVNDMENGQVYWSNWDGLSEITRSIQVQRGLGASKLAIPSVGGTMNIITKGLDSKMSGSLKQEVGNNNMLRTAFGFNSGALPHGWGFTLGLSTKSSNGWVDQTWSKSNSYFVKIQKKAGKHLLSLGANGAPQSHAQRPFGQPIAMFDRDYAKKIGVDVDSLYFYQGHGVSSFGVPIKSRGFSFNPQWGEYIDKNGKVVTVNEKINFFHKPLFNLSDFWNLSDKIYISSIAYLSIGNGGGTGFPSSKYLKTFPLPYLDNGQENFQDIFDKNSNSAPKSYIDPIMHPSDAYLISSINNHMWLGILSSINYTINKQFSLLAGIDGRYYKGTHYRQIYNLLGGDYITDVSDFNQPKGRYEKNIGYVDEQYQIRKVGDKVFYNYEGYVNWGGIFAQLEYKTDKWSAFITGSGSQTGYNRVDYYQRKDLVLDNKVFSNVLGWGDTIYYNGKDTLASRYSSFNKPVTSHSGDTTFVKTGSKKEYILNAKPYTNKSSESRVSTTGWKLFTGYTIKGGANYNINELHNIFINLGYMSMPPRLANVFDSNNRLIYNIKTPLVKSIEMGYGFKTKKLICNLNAYYTIWDNKPVDFPPTVTSENGIVTYNINGLNALHQGIEFDANYKILSNIELNGMASIADWKYTSKANYYATDESGNTLKDPKGKDITGSFSAIGIHVGNAAQMQFGSGIRYNLLKGFYLKARYTYFGKNYASFDPVSLSGRFENYESWKMPDYQILDMYAGFETKGSNNLRYHMTIGVVNILNTVYLSDAQMPNEQYSYGSPRVYDINNMTGFFGMGRRYTVSLKVSF